MADSTHILEWLGMQVRLPHEWEIVRHSVSAKAGSLYIVDRRRQRMQIAWTQCAAQPDIDRIFQDFRSRDLQQAAGCTHSELYTCTGWTCYQRHDKDNAIMTRCGIYDKKGQRWIDLVLPWPGDRDHIIEKNILESFKSVPVDSRDGLQWHAFGMDMKSPAGWKLKSANVKFGLVAFLFENEDAHASVSRFGVTDMWFDGHVDNFLKNRVGDIHGAFSLRMQGGHEACVFNGRERRFHWRWMTGNRHLRRDIAWHCPSRHALYQIMTVSSRKRQVLPDAFSVRCCADAGRA